LGGVGDDEFDGGAAGEGFAEVLVEGVEGALGADEESGDEALAYDDAAVGAPVHSVAGLEHGAVGGADVRGHGVHPLAAPQQGLQPQQQVSQHVGGAVAADGWVGICAWW